MEGELSAYGIDVEVKKKTVEDVEMMDTLDPQIIIDQSPAEGTVLTKGEKVIIYIPDIYDRYPNFVEEKWTVEEVEDFCNTYGVKLEKKYQQTTSYEPGAIIRQSRVADSKISKGATLTITIAEAPPSNNDVNNEDDTKVEDENNTGTDEGTNGAGA